jgi:hypothetical protein
MYRSPQERFAFARGQGTRRMTDETVNPYDHAAEPDLYAAWQSGWDDADREVTSL